MTAVLELGDHLRPELKTPLGPVETDTAAVLAVAGHPLVTVGDIVTYHVIEAGVVPTVAFVDERTQRAAVDRDIRDAIEGSRFDAERTVANPPATLTDDLLSVLGESLDDGGTTLVHVDGEEDLAALPAIAAVPDGASVLYGQPDEGVVHVTADSGTREVVLDLLDRMDGDTDRALELLGFDRDRSDA